MSSNEARQIVQSGLDQKKAERKRRDEALDVQERELRQTINRNHLMKTMNEAQRRAMEQAERERRKEARREARAMEREREEKGTQAVRLYVHSCVGNLLLVGFTSFPWWAAIALALGLAVFPVVYIYRLYVPLGVKA